MNLDVFDQTNGFITQWTVAGDATARTITLPLVNTRVEGALSYNCTVDWGDGSALSTVTAYNDANRIHTYAANGTYNVEIRGTCEGWSFNNAGDKLKITQIIYWGDAGGFNGFKYLSGGFWGCANLTSLGTGVILPSGTGILSDGFNQTFQGCASLASIPMDLFRYNTAVTTDGFHGTFQDCTSLTSIPTDLFRYNTTVTVNAFNSTFWGCVSLTSIPTDLFRYNTAVTQNGFYYTFYNTALTSIPTDLFRYNTTVTSQGFYGTFQGCASLISIPTDLFRYNTTVSTNGFTATFANCTSLTSVPADLFRYNTAVSGAGFSSTFQNCTSLATVPADLFRYNTTCRDFSYVFYGCRNLQVLSNTFYEPGEETTRFLNKSMDFTNSFNRTSFTGTQGTAPDLWTCDFGETITLSTAPATDWAPGDTITGQTSGATALVVSRVSALVYKINQHFGTFTLGETVGVTGVPAKLAAQDGSHPTFSGKPTSTHCFGGAGNSLASLVNYASIPTSWE